MNNSMAIHVKKKKRSRFYTMRSFLLLIT